MARFPKREEAKRRTRRALVEAGIQEIAEKGLDGASVRGICGRAGLTQGAFYVHFESREAMLATCVEAALGQLADRLIRETEGQGLATVAARAFSFLQEGGSDPARRGPIEGLPVHQLLAACVRFPDFQRRVATLVERIAESFAKRLLEGQQAGRIRADVAAEDLARHVLMLVLGMNGAALLGVPFDPDFARRALGRVLGADPA